jgi:D-arabinose 1-dehydrogenase-like Zn-dependent alcohol dehydrogenase
MIEEATLDQVPDLATAVLKGQVRGRVVVDVRR